MPILIYIPEMFKDSISSTFLPTFDALTSMDFTSFCDSHSDLGEVKLNTVLVCISPTASDTEHFFIYRWSFVLLLKRCPGHSLID